MIQAKCIQKFRDKNNNIYGYRLIDINGQTQDVKSDNLKQAIRNKQIQVVNLTLTSDGRLVDRASNFLKSSKLGEAPVQNLAIFNNEMIHKNYETLIRKNPHELATSRAEILYNKHLVFKSLVPSETMNKLMSSKGTVRLSTDIIAYPKDNDTVIIASSKKIALQDSYAGSCDCGLFRELHIKSIDLRDVDMHLMTDMTEMFSNCEATHYNLDGLDLSMCDSYAYMFYRCNAHTISMHGVKINENADTSYMFGEMTANNLLTDNKFIAREYNERVW